ncbi:MAG TPA: glycosyltransferase [Pirellulales bacterium]|nr:glycosyltransferase [Pirellulales bacterium]
MSPPLSILLPVHNVQATLAADVDRLLDVLPELAHWFELVLIDDGSTDATCEVAEELVTEYPQVGLIRHSMRRGIEASWRLGLERSDAPIVVGHNGRPGIEPSAALALLKQGGGRGARDEGRAEEADAPIAGGASKTGLIRWLSARALAGETPAFGGFCILRREAELPLAPHPFGWRIEPAHRIRTTPPAVPEKPARQPVADPLRRATAPRPSFLARLQQLALGE